MRLATWLALAGVVMAVTGCKHPTGGTASRASLSLPKAFAFSGAAGLAGASGVTLPAATTKVDPKAIPEPKLPTPAAGSAMLRVGYAQSSYPELDKLRETLEASHVFESAVAQINQRIKLSSQLDVVLTDCGTVNAFYDPAGSRIIMCYEFFGYLAQTFKPVAKDDTELGNAVVGASLFTFYHELGHALRDKLDLPLVGREEDAVDQLATLIVLHDGAGSPEAAMYGAQWFMLNAQSRKAGEQLPFWDEHSLDEQRYFDIACLIYGSDSEKYAQVAQVLPPERAQRCGDEYRKISSSWQRLLQPYMIDDGGTTATAPATEPATEPAADPDHATDPATATEPAADPDHATEPAAEPEHATEPAAEPEHATEPAADPEHATEHAAEPAAAAPEPANEPPPDPNPDPAAP